MNLALQREQLPPRSDFDSFPDSLERIGFGEAFLDEMCDMLGQLAMFADLEHRELQILSHYLQAYSAPPGLTVIHEGRRDGYMWLVVEGKLDVLKEQEPGRHKLLASIRRGKAIGELCLIDDQPHSANVVTRTAATLLLLTRHQFERLIEQQPRLALKVLRKLTQLISYRLRRTSGLLVDRL